MEVGVSVCVSDLRSSPKNDKLRITKSLRANCPFGDGECVL